MREDQADLAVAKIFEGAGQAFVDPGVGEIARYSGCSRGTLYRYFRTGTLSPPSVRQGSRGAPGE